ncbi:CHAD domain-containing protein [Gordonia sp. NPDC058843]|uniref:CYTH and CHAD domain-containing protein n=1 Tax=Gordonia sp. NPDC058843 TaxID=3346648 RepID=UPI0036905CD5
MHTDSARENTWDLGLDVAIPRFDGSATDTVDIRSAEFTDTYYDTADRDLLAHGVTVVYGEGDARTSGWRVTVPAPDGQTTELIDAPSTAVPAEIDDRLWGLRLGNALTVAAIVHTHRTRRRHLDADHELAYEVIDDSVSATVTGPVATATSWREISVTPGTESSTVPKNVRKRLIGAGARPSSASSTFERAVGHEPATHDGLTPAAAAVADYVREQLAAIFAGDVALRRGESPVHAVRVAIRRLRSTLRTGAHFFDPQGLRTEGSKTVGRQALDDELRWFAGVLGEVRDREVLRARFAAAIAELPDELVLGPVAARIEEELSAQQHHHRQTVVDEMTSDRYRRLLATLATWRVDVPLSSARTKRADVQRTAARAARKADKRLAHALSTGHDEDFHRARKAAKRARYAGELAGPVVSKSAGRGQVKRYKKIQTVLGEHQDAAVAAAALRELGASAGVRNGENGFTYGILYQRELDAAAAARSEVFADRG